MLIIFRFCWYVLLCFACVNTSWVSNTLKEIINFKNYMNCSFLMYTQESEHEVEFFSVFHLGYTPREGQGHRQPSLEGIGVAYLGGQRCLDASPALVVRVEWVVSIP